MLKPTVDAAVDVKDWIDSRPVSPYQWLILSLCFLIVLFDGFDVAVMGFIAPSLMQDWGLSRAAFGPVMSAGMIGLAIGALTAGPYADRLGRKVLLIAVTGFSLLSLACAFARNPYELAVLRLLTGIALGAAMPNSTTLLAEYLPERCRSLLITVMFTGFNMGSGLGGFLAAWLIPQQGWQSVLLAGGVLPLALLPLYSGCCQNPPASWQPARHRHNRLPQPLANSAGASPRARALPSASRPCSTRPPPASCSASVTASAPWPCGRPISWACW